MDFFLWLGQTFIWGVALIFSLIFGWLSGHVAKFFIGFRVYWPGFIVGVAAFMYSTRDLLSIFIGYHEVEEAEKFESAPRPTSSASILPFLIGLWIGSNFLGDNS